MSHVAAYVLAIAEPLAPLRDDLGQPFKWVPCMELPLAWDESSPINVRRRAAQVCRTHCPALRQCRTAMQQLIADGGEPLGVWAGEVLGGRAAIERGKRLPPLPIDRFSVASLSCTVRHTMAERSPCKYCGLSILWARTAENRPMPLDPAESADGNVAVIRDDRQELVCRVLGKGDSASPGERRHMPHFATCKNWPKQKAKKQNAPRRPAKEASREQLAMPI